MTCFEVSVNGERLCRAGVGEFGVLSAMTSWVRRRDPPPSDVEDWREEELVLDVGGLHAGGRGGDDEHRRWPGRPLKLGDVVTIQVIENETCDEPESRTTVVKREEAERQRQQYLRLKEKFETQGGA